MTNNTIPNAQAYTFSAPVGFAGDITRQLETNVEPALLIAIAGVFAPSFGLAMVYASGGISQWGASNVQADFAGILIREVPQIAGALASDSATPPDGGTPEPTLVHGLLVRGYCAVICGYGTPARGGVVYVRTVANTNNEVVGTFDATSDSSNSVALSITQATWACDGKDSNNIAEIRVAR
jgi:hypothetical protein